MSFQHVAVMLMLNYLLIILNCTVFMICIMIWLIIGPLNLQQSIDQLVLWSNMWQLILNIIKCHVLSIRNKTRTNTTYEYLLEGSHLSYVSIITDLGINIYSRPIIYPLNRT